MDKFAIILAGGTGQRMGNVIPKQFLRIKNEIILMKSIRAFFDYDPSLKIIITLPEDQIIFWNNLCLENNFSIKHTIVKGGHTRFHSVKNAINLIDDKGIVAIHDGVRPLVNKHTIGRVFEGASEKGNAIPCIDIIDSIRFVDSTNNSPVDRNKYKLIQTPQAFDCGLIKRAYKQEWHEAFTDDASVAEMLGVQINLVPGNPENLKITTQTDLYIAEALSGHLLE